MSEGRAGIGATLLPVAALVGSIVSLCVGTSFAKHLFPVLGAQGTVALRVGFAALILVAFWRPWRWALSGRDARAIALYGAVLGSMNLMFYMALRTLPLGVCIAIEFTGPLAVAILSSRRALDFLWIGFAVLGLGLLLPLREGAARLDPVGVAFTLGAATCWALYILLGKRIGHLHPGQSVSLGMCTAAVVAAPFGIAHAGIRLLDPSLMLAALGVAVFSSAVPYTLEMVALKRLPKQVFGVLLSLEPAVGALSALVILGERPTVMQWAAIAAIIAASAGAALTIRRAEPAPPLP